MPDRNHDHRSGTARSASSLVMTAAKPQPKRTPVSLKARGVQLLAQREHSVVELRKKLLFHAKRLDEALEPFGFAAETSASDPPSPQRDGITNPIPDEIGAKKTSHADAVEPTIQWLQNQGFLDNERFAQSRIHVRATRFGNRRIYRELAEHHVQLSTEQVQELKTSEFDRAQQVHQRKFRNTSPPLSTGDLAKQARFLSQRGFSPEVVRKVLRAAAQTDIDIEYPPVVSTE